MANVVLTTITSGYNINKINDNFVKLKDAHNSDSVNLISGNNVMGQDLDMNSNDLLNVHQVNTDSLRIGGQLVIPSTSTTIPIGSITGTDISPAYEATLAKLPDLASTTPSKGAALIGWPSGYGVNQPATGQFFSQNGAAIQRFNDRVFVGGATVNDGAYPGATPDWLTTYQNAFGVPPLVRSSQLAALTNAYSGSAIGATFGSQTLNFGSAGASSIGVSAVAIANNTTLGSRAWAFYGEAHKAVSNGASVYGMELDVFSSVATITPNAYQQGDTIALQLGSGANGTSPVDASAAIQIVASPAKFKAGIVFQGDSLTGSDGTTGTAIALAMGKGHTIQWYAPGAVPTASILCVAATNTNVPYLQLTNGSLQIRSVASGKFQYILNVNDSAANYFSLSPAAAGAPPQIVAGGTDANIDFGLFTKGTGVLNFGTFTSGAPTANGYITIKDQAGNVRKLLCG